MGTRGSVSCIPYKEHESLTNGDAQRCLWSLAGEAKCSHHHHMGLGLSCLKVLPVETAPSLSIGGSCWLVQRGPHGLLCCRKGDPRDTARFISSWSECTAATPIQSEAWRCLRSGSGDTELGQGSKHITTATTQIVSPFPLGLLIEFQQNKCFKIPSVTKHTSLFLRYGNYSCPKLWDEMPVVINLLSFYASEIKIYLLPYQSRTEGFPIWIMANVIQ